MTKPRSYVTFKDGHEEEIIYFTQYEDQRTIFATESGIYARIAPGDIQKLEFENNHALPCNNLPSILFGKAVDVADVFLDFRVSYSYTIIGKDGTIIEGTVFHLPHATNKDIHNLIMEDISIEYNREE